MLPRPISKLRAADMLGLGHAAERADVERGEPKRLALPGGQQRVQDPQAGAGVRRGGTRPNPRTATGPPQTLLVFRGCGRLHRRQRGACVGGGPSVRRRPIGDRAAPASVRSSSDGLTARIHATEPRARMRPMDRRAAASGGGSGRLRRALADARSGRASIVSADCVETSLALTEAGVYARAADTRCGSSAAIMGVHLRGDVP